MNIKRPMLAATATKEDLDNLRYPILASPKLDGIRVLHHPVYGVVTRKLKPVPNLRIRQMIQTHVPVGVDGEVVTFNDLGQQLSFNEIQSDVMSHSGMPIFQFQAFDNFGFAGFFSQRLASLEHIAYKVKFLEVVPHYTLLDSGSFREFASKCIEDGYEGAMIRDPEGPYKEGRSTLKEGWLVKYKEFMDAEGIVVDFEELQHNENEQTRDRMGLAERSSHKAQLRPGNTLGALIVETKWGTLRIGTGFDDALRWEIWNNKDRYAHRVVTFKYQTYGMQDLPRFPVFLYFRED